MYENPPYSTRFLPPSPPLEAARRLAFAVYLGREYERCIETSGNSGVLTGKKRADYKRWLLNPSSIADGETYEEKQLNHNARTQALRHFEL